MEAVLLRESKFSDERRKELEQIIATYAEEIKLSPRDKKRYDLFFDKIAERNREMDEVQGDWRSEDGAEILFEKLFGFTPEGEVLIKRGPVSFFVEIRNENDYVKAHGNDSAKSSGGFNRGFVSVARNDGEKWSQEQVDRIFMHEERHALHRNIRDLMGDLNEEESLFVAHTSRDVPKYVGKLDKQSQERAKDEILAYLKDGSTGESIRGYLRKSKSEGGLYDYFQEREDWVEENWKDEEMKKTFKTEAAEQRKHFEEVRDGAIDIVERLEGIGMARPQITVLFNTVPLAKWSSEVRRLEDEGVFAHMRQEALRLQRKEKERLEMIIRQKSSLRGVRRFFSKGFANALLPFSVRERLVLDKKDAQDAAKRLVKMEEFMGKIQKPFS